MRLSPYKRAATWPKVAAAATFFALAAISLQAQQAEAPPAPPNSGSSDDAPPATPPPPNPERISEAVETVVEGEEEAIATQSRIDSISETTQDLEAQYRTVLRELDVANRYNAQMREIIGSQEREIQIIENDLSDLQDTQREIVPLLLRMIEALDQFVAADTPFLPEERRGRVAELKSLMDRGDVSLAEKYRRVFDAYQQENNLARNIEATTGPVTFQGENRTVEFLRVGRVAYYFKSLDGDLIARWDEASDGWVVVENGSEKLSILRAFKIARKELPVDLLVLPVAQP